MVSVGKTYIIDNKEYYLMNIYPYSGLCRLEPVLHRCGNTVIIGGLNIMRTIKEIEDEVSYSTC